MAATRRRRRVLAAGLAALTLAAGPAVGRVLAHGGSLGGDAGRTLDVPTWLFLSTGGAVVGVSFLLSSFATDREFVARVHAYRRRVVGPNADRLATLGQAVGIVGLLLVIGVGVLGPIEPRRNAGVLLVWGGWWAGLAMSAYLLGNAWPVIDPWRTLAGILPTGDRDPSRLPVAPAWLSTVGLLMLFWVEIVSPLADAPRLLATVTLAYTAVALAGAVAFGEAYFTQVDPVARVFRLYGAVAPLTWEDGLRLRPPGAGLTADLLRSRGEVGFVLALLWGTTYDGLVATPPWARLVRTVVAAGIPPAIVYPLALAVGYLIFYGAYLLAVRYGAQFAETRRGEAELARRFAPSLLAIAAGYHVAHYLGYFLTLAPALAAALAMPWGPGPPARLVLPGWFGGLSLAFVLAGHLLAVWVAHGVAYELFPSRMQAVRSQYALTVVMMLYTMTSLWIVSRPYAAPPFIS
ncbi:hypothetical protein [Halosegnis sp.]|uniref:hypothetical protein n=1 Tax=Halosegnis sp. TaxID=2864959 RepID=UPI0035D4FB26